MFRTVPKQWPNNSMRTLEEIHKHSWNKSKTMFDEFQNNIRTVPKQWPNNSMITLEEIRNTPGTKPDERWMTSRAIPEQWQNNSGKAPEEFQNNSTTTLEQIHNNERRKSQRFQSDHKWQTISGTVSLGLAYSTSALYMSKSPIFTLNKYTSNIWLSSSASNHSPSMCIRFV